MKKLCTVLFALLLSSNVIAAPIDLSNRDNMVGAISALIIATQPYCFGFRWAVNAAPQDKMDNFARLYGHQVDAKYNKDVIVQIGKASCRERVWIPV